MKPKKIVTLVLAILMGISFLVTPATATTKPYGSPDPFCLTSASA